MACQDFDLGTLRLKKQMMPPAASGTQWQGPTQRAKPKQRTDTPSDKVGMGREAAAHLSSTPGSSCLEMEEPQLGHLHSTVKHNRPGVRRHTGGLASGRRRALPAGTVVIFNVNHATLTTVALSSPIVWGRRASVVAEGAVWMWPPGATSGATWASRPGLMQGTPMMLYLSPHPRTSCRRAGGVRSRHPMHERRKQSNRYMSLPQTRPP
jgi:hypothetical protein